MPATHKLLYLVSGYLALTLPTTAIADSVEDALRAVRDIKADIHSRRSSVLGELASPEEMAAHQMRCRPAPRPRTGLEREMAFDEQTIQRAARISPDALCKANPRFGLGALPLGITGAYVKESANKVELLVVHVVEDSPAAGPLQVKDVIIGANGRLFEDREDPRPDIGYSLCESQSPELGGLLTLHAVRDKKPMNITIDLECKLGYSATWPYDCAKSKQVRLAALESVIKSYPWDRRDFWTPLFLMASGDDAALELARRHLCAELPDRFPPGRGARTWSQSYRLINLCEYYLLTGDSYVLPAIRYQAECLGWAQYRSGSWSHGGGHGTPAPGTCHGGYGEINNAGLGAFIGLCLARRCEIEPFAHTLPRAIRFFGKFCGTNFPYGLGKPGARGGRMDNGMNSAAAIAFHLLGEDAMAERWARTVCYMWMGRERGHAEAIFSGAWGPVGAALAPRPEFHAFMNNMAWTYEMGRARDGSITFMRGGRWQEANMTAAMGLFLYLPERRLQLLGGDSVFAQPPPEGLEKAAQLYKDKRWKELTGFLTAHLAAPPVSPQHRAYAEKLLAAYNRLEAHAAATLEIIEQSIDDGMPATAQVQLDLLARMMGEERPAAARLRQRLPDGKLKDARRERRQPLIDRKAVIKSLELAARGIDNGFAHSGQYIRAANKRGFESMQPEQIARFFNSPSHSPVDGAVNALAERGEAVVPLLKRMLEDTHPGVRAGALAVFSEMYEHDGNEYRSEAPEELREMIELARPLTRDKHPMVRNAATGLLLGLKILNDDVVDVLRDMAKLEDARIDHAVRYGIKDPTLRTELCMELIATCNRTRCSTPDRYKPINWAVGAHLDLCGPYVQTAIDTLNNPAVTTLYGFFSQSPREKSMELLFAYCDDPLVLANLPTILAFDARRQSEFNKWAVMTVEYPHRIVIKLGPRALPVLDEFCRSERKHFENIQAGREEQPVWWKENSVSNLQNWVAQMQVTAEITRCLHGQKPTDQAVPSLCEIYLSNRPWGAWERRQMRDYFTTLGMGAVPHLRKAAAAVDGSPRAELDRQIAAKRREIEEPGQHRRQKEKREVELDVLLDDAKRYEELAELAALIEALGAMHPKVVDVKTLCRFYVKRPWGKQYPFMRNETSYLRPFDATQHALIRDTFIRWSRDALPGLRAFLEEDRSGLAAALKRLDEEQAYWDQQRARLRGGPLARIAFERKDLPRYRAELEDIVLLLECIATGTPAVEQLPRLCEVYTRRAWPRQNRIILALLEHAGEAAGPVIREHIEKERRFLPELAPAIDLGMVKPASPAKKEAYDRARALKANILRGIVDLDGVRERVSGKSN